MKRSSWNTSERARGFTLLEVMAAVAIIAIALVPLLRSQAQSIRAAGKSQNLTIATLLARTLMTDIEVEEFPQIGEVTGSFEDLGYPQFEYMVEVSNFEYLTQLLETVGFGAMDDFVREVRVTITWSGNLQSKDSRGPDSPSPSDQLKLTAILINDQLSSLLPGGGGGGGGGGSPRQQEPR